MNYETIQNYLNTPIQDFFKDRAAIEEAKNVLKKFECFEKLLKDNLMLFEECERISSLQLLENLALYDKADRSFILGFKAGIQSFKRYYGMYEEARELLNKEGA